MSPTKYSTSLSTTVSSQIIDLLLPKEQAEFRRGKSTMDQVVLFTQNIEDSFQNKEKAGAVFCRSDSGLTCKLLRLLSDKHMVRMIMELVRNRSFLLLLMTASKVGYAVLKAAFLRDRSWLPPFRHVYERPTSHDFQKVCLRGRSSIAALFLTLKEPGGDFKSRHDYTFNVSSDFEVKAQSHKDGDGGFHLNN